MPDLEQAQFASEHARRWQDADAARSYRSRPPYPAETFDILASLIADEPRHVLDVGCGTGKLARELVPRVARMDAVDLAAEMVAEGVRLPGGDAANLRWSVGRAEDAPLDPPYALVVGGESLHWMDWPIVLPRFARAHTERGARNRARRRRSACAVARGSSGDHPPAMSTLTRAHIDATRFDGEMRDLLAPYCPDGILRRPIRGQVDWGRPLAG